MIEFKNVYMVYPGGATTLENINLTVADGEFVFVVGHSGAGKSTLMKLLLREEKVASGKLIVDGVNIDEIPNKKIADYRRNIGFVFQDFNLFEDKTVYENIAFPMRVVGTPSRKIRTKVEKLMQLLHLPPEYEKRYPENLSGGEQQRVALARALANNPKYIIADEPTGNVDPKMSMEMMNQLIYIQQTLGKTVIVVTHELEFAKSVSDKVIFMADGVIEEMGTPEDIFDNAKSEKTRAFLMKDKDLGEIGEE